MLIAARAMQGGLAILKPLLADSDAISEGRVVIGTVKGDLHDIGKNLVSMMLEGAEFEAIDPGVDVSPEAFVGAIKENRPQILALSALLTTTMTMMKDTITALREAGVRDQVKVVIGGAPVTQSCADEIGVDWYSDDAGGAAKTAKTLLSMVELP
jgi:5-methyltetrahydrofolate--homocysteine methyltransferase